MTITKESAVNYKCFTPQQAVGNYLVKANPFYGNSIEKKKIPPEYGVQNLWRVELTGYWRMLYTIKGNQIEVICFVLDILDHKKYDKKFGYKKK